MSMEWQTEDISGHLMADGKHGKYYIMDCFKCVHLDATTFDAAGPITKNIGVYKTSKEAKAVAAAYDLGATQ